jgi:tripartite-type tricarboxylate transporter receptor subunit TctC
MFSCRSLLAGLALALSSSPLLAGPPLTLIYPAPAGGGGANYFRILAKAAEGPLDSPVVVLNIAGAGGSIGLARMIASKPDGLTVAGVWPGPVTIMPHTFDVSYKPSDYIPVLQISSAPYTLCTAKDFPANTGAELIDLLRKNPDKYSFGTDGPGGLAQLAATRVFRAFGTSQRDVPYKGAAETVLALIGKHIDIYSGSVQPVLPFVKSGAAKCLIVTSSERSTALPQAASMADLGIPKEETLNWRAVLAPRGTPPATVARLEQAFEEAARSPESLKFLEDAGENVRFVKGPALAARLRDEYESMGQVLKAMGMTPAK